jgi:hypothetical protein
VSTFARPFVKLTAHLADAVFQPSGFFAVDPQQTMYSGLTMAICARDIPGNSRPLAATGVVTDGSGAHCRYKRHARFIRQP